VVSETETRTIEIFYFERYFERSAKKGESPVKIKTKKK